MTDNAFTYDELIDLSIDAVWSAMKRTSELDVLGGQQVIERDSDADWTCRTDERNTSRCHADYDEPSRTVTVTIASTAKRVKDTTTIEARAEGDGTRVTVTAVIRGGAVVSAMLKLIGRAGVQSVNRRIVANIATLARGGATHTMTEEEISAAAGDRLDALRERSGRR